MGLLSNGTNSEGSPGRAIAFTGGLLLATVALAASMTLRSPSVERIHPPGWTLSFESPPGFDKGQFITRDDVEFLSFLGQGENGEVLIVVRRFTHLPPDATPHSICKAVVAKIIEASPRRMSVQSQPLIRQIGLQSAIEIDLQSPPAMVRATIVDKDGYVVSLQAEPGTLPDTTSMLHFDRLCRSARKE